MFRVVEDPARGAVLDRSAGVEKFGLGENSAAGFSADARKADERDVTDVVPEKPSRMFIGFRASAARDCAALAASAYLGEGTMRK